MFPRFNHTNIVSRDPKRLSEFYIDVFECTVSGPWRHLRGDWLGRGMGLEGAQADVIHLLLPGHGEEGPTLEIFSLPEVEPGPTAVNRYGLMHLAFGVEDVAATLEKIVAAGGERLGEVTEAEIEGVGVADFVYARDPEGNIVELQHWKSLVEDR